jgi:hypothetical protein
VRDYFEAVTLSAFSFRDTGKAAKFCSLTREIRVYFTLFHFILVSVALNFPLMLSIARLPPYEVYMRLYGENFAHVLPEEMQMAFIENAPEGSQGDETLVDDFNLYMYQNGYGKIIMLPLIGTVFIIVLILQTVFYLLATFFMGLQRMTSSPLPFPCRLSFLIFSSTLPAFLSALFGLWMPTVHIIIFYFAVIIISFYRSKLCQNG